MPQNPDLGLQICDQVSCFLDKPKALRAPNKQKSMRMSRWNLMVEAKLNFHEFSIRSFNVVMSQIIIKACS